MRPKCKYCNTRKMEFNFVKIKKPGEKTIYYCSQKHFEEDRNMKFKWNRDENVGYIDWAQMNVSGW